MNKVIRLIISIALPVGVGLIAGMFTAESVRGWFQTIEKPSFNPPSWVFAPVWTTLYILMGIGFYLVWVSPRSQLKTRAMMLYFIQLALNGAWSFIFFYSQEPGWAFAEIMLLWLSIFVTMILFWRISATAGWTLVPYLAWVSFAAVLNYSIWQLNS
jgi:translocator protein